MKHLGDITKIHGDQIEPVDVITFGSPCQDLSVAGKRAGLAGERSGLFMEAVRIIKEMRSATDGIYPNFAVWENVPGAFSSNKGEDFRAVLEELVRIQEPDTVIPKPPKGKWNTSGAIVGNRWSLAWRVLDAQFWGVPQRRRRIALVMDFAGQSAPEILFERKGMQRYSAPCRKARKRIAGDIKGCAERTGRNSGAYGVDAYNHTTTGDKAVTLTAASGSSPTHSDPMVAVPYGICSYASNSMKSDNPHSGVYIADTSRTLDLNGGNPACNQGGIAICEPVAGIDCRNLAESLRANMGDNQTAVVIENHPTDSRVKLSEDNKVQTLTSRMGTGGGNVPLVLEQKSSSCLTHCKIRYRVRRLTPLECERLQGYPDYWTVLPKITDMLDATYAFWCNLLFEQAVREEKARLNEETGIYEAWRFVKPEMDEESEDEPVGHWENTGKPYKSKTIDQMIKWYNKSFADPDSTDSARYKALGNSIALPPWKWVLKRISAQFERDATLGSLFDGIGGFPLIWEQLNGKGSARWASEIEQFPIAVTKYHFDGGGKNQSTHKTH